ncbi:hypothetical protein Q3G72_018016 [Acer saccharum]|nr:hypothetical protein Q3G72_018016 [Acer saccharum]
MRDGKESVMLLKYERLPDHCFRCGRLGHIVRDCLEVKIGDGPEDFDQLFGSWLKADSPVKLGKFRQRREDNLPGDVRPKTRPSEGVLQGNCEKEVIRIDACGSSAVTRKVLDANTVVVGQDNGGPMCSRDSRVKTDLDGVGVVIGKVSRKEVDYIVDVGVVASGLVVNGGLGVIGQAEKAHLDTLFGSSLNVIAEGIGMGLRSVEMEVDGSIHKPSFWRLLRLQLDQPWFNMV